MNQCQTLTKPFLKDILLEPYRAFKVLSSLDCGATAIIEMELLNTPLFSFSWETIEENEQVLTETKQLETSKKGKQEQQEQSICQVEE